MAMSQFLVVNAWAPRIRSFPSTEMETLHQGKVYIIVWVKAVDVVEVEISIQWVRNLVSQGGLMKWSLVYRLLLEMSDVGAWLKTLGGFVFQRLNSFGAAVSCFYFSHHI